MFGDYSCVVCDILSCARVTQSIFKQKIIHQPYKSYKGASIYDVRTKGGGWVSPKEDVVKEVA